MYLDKYYKQLDDLRDGQKRFCDIYEIMKGRFQEEIFGVEFFDGLETKTTYSEFYTLCESFAGALKERFKGKEGSTVAIRMDNSVMWCVAFFGTLMAGFKAFLVNTRLDEESIATAVERTDALCVICDKDNGMKNYIPA